MQENNLREIKKYMEITRLGHSSALGVLNVGDKITITEKIDGANASFAYDKNNPLGVTCYSRRQTLDKDNTLRGYYGWVMDNIVPIKEKLNPKYRYIGEWLVSHKVVYKQECYDNFYMFSIYDDEKEQYVSDDIVIEEAKRLGLKTVEFFYIGEYISKEHLQGFVGKSNITKEPNQGEGIVVKNNEYFDKYGKQKFVKIVSDSFMEIKKIKTKLQKTYNTNEKELNTIKSVCTKVRIEKMLYKLLDENLIEKTDLEIEQMSKLIKLLKDRLLEDMLKEESEILSYIDNSLLQKLYMKVFPVLLKEVLKEM